MNKIYFQDTATLAFQPLINLAFSPFATLSSQASLHWLNSEFSPIQWGAFMHFCGPTRKLLKIGGLNLEDEDFLKINSSNEKWNLLITGYLNNDLDIRKQLYLIRLLFYLGFYKQGLQLCEKIIAESSIPEDRIWAKYLQELGNSIHAPSNWSPTGFTQEIESLKTEISPFFFFHISLLFAKFFIRNSDDVNSAKKWLNKATLLLEDFEFSTDRDSNLARIRLDKYKADLHFKLKKPHEATSLLQNACRFSDASILKSDKDSSYLYLFKETKRRLLDALILHYYRSKNTEKAFKYAQESVHIDPYCSYALLLAGKTAAHIDRELSKRYFEKAAKYGILERPYAKQALANQFDSSLRTRDLQIEALDGNTFLIREEGSDSSKEIVKLPIEMSSLDKIARSYSENIHWEQIKSSSVYQCSLPFWELQSSHNRAPIFCSEPLVALEVFKNQECPWFKTLYLQRAMPLNFREELIFAVAPHTAFAILHQSRAIKVEILRGRSERADRVLSIHCAIETLPKLERIFFCRLLGALGFYEEALKGLPLPEKNALWDFEDEYAFCTKLFFEHIYFAGTALFPHQDIEFAFEKLSTRSESLRMRLVLTILGCVYHGKRAHIQLLQKWREKGFESLVAVQNSKHFDEFEKNLLTSRFYRAVTFYPFLIKDSVSLRKEAEMCESYARSLTPQNEKQQLLYRENLFPMLESMARIFNHFGEAKMALNLMEEIVHKVDTQDAKAWIQVGEAREKNGDFAKALEAFQTAIEIGIPLAGIACYRAGRTCEKIGDLNEAKHYYIRSLKFCPKGLSPLKRLNTISKALGDLYLKNWSEANLNNLRTHFGPVA